MILEKSPSASAERLLKVLYRSRLAIKPVYVPDVAYEMGLSAKDALDAWAYLKEQGFIKTFALAGAAIINEKGVAEVETPSHFSTK